MCAATQPNRRELMKLTEIGAWIVRLIVVSSALVVFDTERVALMRDVVLKAG